VSTAAVPQREAIHSPTSVEPATIAIAPVYAWRRAAIDAVGGLICSPVTHLTCASETPPSSGRHENPHGNFTGGHRTFTRWPRLPFQPPTTRTIVLPPTGRRKRFRS